MPADFRRYPIHIYRLHVALVGTLGRRKDQTPLRSVHRLPAQSSRRAPAWIERSGAAIERAREMQGPRGTADEQVTELQVLGEGYQPRRGWIDGMGHPCQHARQ